jgi:hypothetical protein
MTAGLCCPGSNITIEVEAKIELKDPTKDKIAGQATAVAICPETDMLSTNYSNICKHDNTSNYQVRVLVLVVQTVWDHVGPLTATHAGNKHGGTDKK